MGPKENVDASLGFERAAALKQTRSQDLQQLCISVQHWSSIHVYLDVQT